MTLPFSFLILLIWILSLFFLSLAKGLLILFIFSNCQLLVSSIFAIVFFVSISFISALIFMISFLLLTLGFGCSSFSSCFRNKVRLFIRDFFLFLEVRLYCYKILLKLPLLHPIGFGSSCFHCCLSLGIFKISSLIYLVIHWLFSNILFSLHVFVFFSVFFFSVTGF